MRVKYLIIGNSAGGIGAAEAIREVDKTGSLLVISDEPYPAYSRPLISEYLAGGCPWERMLYRPADFYEMNNIQTFLSTKVEHLDIAEHTVELEDGQKIAWEKLLLATGGLPIVPQIEGIGRRGVFTFTTLDDAKAIDKFLTGTSRAVVIGGGLIGVSVTEALVKRGARVTVVEMKERILNTMLDEETSALEEAALRRAGVNIVTGHTVVEINGDSSPTATVSSVTLDDGSQTPCNLVVVAIGVRPRTELVLDTGIKTNRGLIVNHYMATSCPHIYACGDAAEAYDFIYNENRLTPIWPNAYLGGRVVGSNMAGILTEYSGGTAMNSLKYFGVDIVSAGMVTPADDSYQVVSQKNGNTSHKVVLKDGLVMGMVFAGNIEKSGIVFSLMRDKVNVEEFKEALVADDFSLASLPEEIWREWLAIPETASPVTSPDQPEEIVLGE
ncbi:MAG: NAD(P)/FAD-dependent oxidoreductase [Chloroflexi bacterium]|nr:NAD(P)/FAD-dependent oxidoreductase [Chloroflexota bacterium]